MVIFQLRLPPHLPPPDQARLVLPLLSPSSAAPHICTSRAHRAARSNRAEEQVVKIPGSSTKQREEGEAKEEVFDANATENLDFQSDELQAVKAEEAMWRNEVEEDQLESNDLFEEQRKQLVDSLDGLVTRIPEAELNVIKDLNPSRVEGLFSLSDSTDIDTSADELLRQSEVFSKHAGKQRHKCLARCCKTCLQSAEKCMQSLEECVQGSCEVTDKCFRYLRARIALKNKLAVRQRAG